MCVVEGKKKKLFIHLGKLIITIILIIMILEDENAYMR